MQPLVSVIIPTFNRAAYLSRALDSVMAQTCTDWEIVVVDDGSTDDTPEVIRRYAVPLGAKLLYLKQSNHGSSHARNAGIEASGGRYIAFLDSDDEYLPTKLARQLELFARHPDLGLVYCDYSYVDLEGTRHESAFDTKCTTAREVATESVGSSLLVCNETLFDTLLQEYFISTIAGMVRRDVLSPSIRFPEGVTYAEEWVFYLRVAAKCLAGFVDEPLCLHHFLEGSLARSGSTQNTVQLTHTLDAIEAAFPNLTTKQRGVLAEHKARSYRQMGYDAHREGRFGDAARAFAESFRCAPRLKVLGEAGDSIWRSIGGPKGQPTPVVTPVT